WLIEHLRAPLIVATRERHRALQRQIVTFDVRKPPPSEQHAMWQSMLQVTAPQLNGQVDAVVSQFCLSAASIHAAGIDAIAHAAQGPEHDLGSLLWDACRVQARPRMNDLAQRIEPAADWDDLVLPEAQGSILREIAAHVRQRATVYEAWGFG